ncbi:MAG TPA: hypothetical protein VFB73_03820 [Chloroflexota bacterium]|nr:hypothetical protein [Chloroflexota bacterium]
MDRQRRLLAALTVAIGLVLACSPEAERTRGGGPGADIGNRGPSVELHGQSNPYYHTPLVGEAVRK